MLMQRAENHDLRAGANHVGNVLRGLFSVLQLKCQLDRNEEILGNALVVAVQRVGDEPRAGDPVWVLRDDRWRAVLQSVRRVALLPSLQAGFEHLTRQLDV